MSDAKIQRAETRARQLQHRVVLLEARLKTSRRKAETRRLILLGRWLELQMARNPKVAKWVGMGLDKWLVRERDREVCGL